MRALGALFSGLDIFVPQVGFAQRGCRVGSRPIVDGVVVTTGNAPPMSSPKPTPLPSDALAHATATFSAIASDSGSNRVKFAARCWQELLERHTPVDLRKISVQYLAENHFRITNTNHRGVALNFRLGAGLDSGEFGVPKSGEYVLTVDTVRTLRVYEGKKFIGSAVGRGTNCK